ncbi:hypothetical protein ABT214_09390 [Micromonospora purpureochromogenes]|uniref:hypothetical protein n=1 Tax=Micromonospora purpureochromogenes TaxID=47872 RepID=UPI0033182EE0
MSDRTYSGLFIAEGSSDQPLAEHIELLFYERGVDVKLSHPAFERLPKVGKDVGSRVESGIKLMDGDADLIVVHRDADNAGHQARLNEIRTAVGTLMTEAWLLLDEAAIRQVAGNPRGRMNLGLPKLHEVESTADPKRLLRECILRAAEVTGRRRETVKGRFDEHRRQLLSRLDRSGPVRRLDSWNRLVNEIDHVVKYLR